ncbi:hypothetical protein [Chryseobacterium aurantiacum]|uniref:hypothetical protein n=1 Tax=Chryseobacterium aurantiacum TaxID=2116499 RepID=UPI000D13B457|nr:hypothetical protein [Chryseobacterium aurantiacum]
MKIAYIIPLLFLSTIAYAQESKKAAPAEDQTLAVKQIKEHEAKILKDTQENAEKKNTQTGLVSDHGLEVKQQASKSKAPADNNSGQLLPSTASLEDIKRTIPNRQANHSIKNSRNTNNTMIGLPNTATLEEIKKTIPKN